MPRKSIPKAPPAKMGANKKLTKDPTLAPRIQACLERGLTIEMACAECGISKATYYNYAKDDLDFLDMVTRAQAVALSKAVKAFASGLEPQKVNHAEINTFTETRIGKDGNPYQYTKESRATKLIETPPDWRAGESWLKRRDRDNWSEKALELNININIELVAEVVNALQKAGKNPTVIFEKMKQRLNSGQLND